MFGLFKKKSDKEKLQETYAKMMADAHKLSHSNRTAADKLMAEAEEVAKQIDANMAFRQQGIGRGEK